ncbi:MAG: hypothetical protein CVV27_16260 [Candidatus Melainabacteria bacterium HGW-Melainabacteria-1]|nr:MAG: hypothetical protein CVV27_16260 [Candidatus Melainabacteria bacterium HGW-Melainabacteria-1]
MAELAQLERLEQPPVVALWHPFAEPDDAETEALSSQLADFEGLDLMLLPPLLVAEQKALLQRAERIWLSPEGWQAYYLWWALSLGTAPWLSARPDQHMPCPGFAAEELAPLTELSLPPGIAERLQQAMLAHQSQTDAQFERAAWTLRAWMVHQNCQGELWTEAEPHMLLAL